MLIAGLGNPGSKYDRTRHNLGFMVIDELGSRYNADFREGYKGLYSSVIIEGEKVFLLKPMTYMNLSGESVAMLANFYKIEPEDIFVVHDDLDIEYGRIKLKKGGNSGGHNGIKSIISQTGSKDFIRLKCGIGKNDGGKDTTSHVLGKFKPEEKEKLEEYVNNCCDALVSCIKHGLRDAMNRFNNKSIFNEE